MTEVGGFALTGTDDIEVTPATRVANVFNPFLLDINIREGNTFYINFFEFIYKV
jgi:hypothetical protein